MHNNRKSVGQRCAPEGQRSQERTVFEGFFSAVCSQGTFCAAHMVKGTWKCFFTSAPRGFGLNSPVHFVVVELGALQLEDTKPHFFEGQRWQQYSGLPKSP